MQKYFEQGVRKMNQLENNSRNRSASPAEAGQRAQTEDVVLPGEHHPEVPLPEIQDTAAHAAVPLTAPARQEG